MYTYVACDLCGEWYHFSCVGLQECSPEDAENLKYVCQICEDVNCMPITGIERPQIPFEYFIEILANIEILPVKLPHFNTLNNL